MIRLARAFGLKRISGKAVSLALIAALVWTAALPLASAQAGHRHGHGGDALAAGVIGFAVGAIIANGANRYSQPLYTYQQPQPIYIQPQPIYIQPQPQYRPYSGPRYYKSLSHYPVQSQY